MVEYSRRDILKSAAATGAAALLGSRSSHAAVGADYDVVIVGAGMAGMTAARLLSQAGPGLKVLILEARDRVGGRMYTLYDKEQGLPRHGVEVGAQFIHGSKASSWELIKEFDIQTRARPGPGELDFLYYEPGRSSYRPDWEAAEQLQASVGSAYGEYIGPDSSYKAFVDGLGLGPLQREQAYAEALSWSAEPDRQSLKAVIEDGARWDSYKDDDFQLVGGHGKLAAKMADELFGKIQLSSPVSEIFWRHGLAGISYNYRGSKTSITARRVIITAPIGVLQSNTMRIEPALPNWKQRAIDSLEMGQVVVAPMLFSEPFWQKSITAPGGWISPADRIVFSANHPVGEAGHAVTGWFQGRAASELSALGAEAGMEQVLAWFEAASGVGKLREKLSWHHFQDWVSDPYSLGSYSVTRPGGLGQRAALARPVANTLYFAGEATAAPPHYQTVHGAYSSGKRVASEVATSLKVGKREDTPATLEEEDEPIIDLL
ncbi:MAG: NAD(P)/FAD-dependent oxidoreductase [Halieaceae bacterium]